MLRRKGARRPAQRGDYATVRVDQADGDKAIKHLNHHTQPIGAQHLQCFLGAVVVDVEDGRAAETREGQQTHDNRDDPGRHTHQDHVFERKPALEVRGMADAHQAAHGDP